MQPLQLNTNTTGWGPQASQIPSRFKNIPYTPMQLSIASSTVDTAASHSKQQTTKHDYHLGKIADWIGQAQHTTTKRKGTVPSSLTGETFEDGQGSGTGADKFSVVSRAPTLMNRNKYQQQNRSMAIGNSLKKTSTGSGMNAPSAQQKAGKKQMNQRNFASRSSQTYVQSVVVKKSWKLKQQINLDQLKKNMLDGKIDTPEDLRMAGCVRYYDPKFDKVSVEKKVPLEENLFEKYTFFNVTTSEDPIMKELAEQEDDPEAYTVLTTDVLLSALMSSSRSVFPWDLVFIKEGNQIWIDKRREASEVDMLTVNETAKEPPLLDDNPENINSLKSLREEATIVNQNFSQQILQPSKTLAFEEPNPFKENRNDAEIASVGYRYRKWKIAEDLVYIVRSEIDGVSRKEGAKKPLILSIKALNEYNPTENSQNSSLDWRTRLENSKGMVLVSEFKNNSNKISRWAIQSMLAGADLLLLGFVSRANFNNKFKHQILGIERISDVRSFGYQLDLNMNNMWGIANTIIEQIIKCTEDGKFVLVREPNKPSLKLFYVPENEDEDDDEADDFEEEESDILPSKTTKKPVEEDLEDEDAIVLGGRQNNYSEENA